MNMEIIGPLLLSLIAGLSTLIGTIFIFFKINKVGEFIVLSLSFSLGIMSMVSIFDLLPDSIPKITNNYGLFFGVVLSLLIFLLGYLSISKINSKINVENDDSLYKIGILSMISLMLHNFPEGSAVFVSAYSNMNIGLKICIAIILHNIPEGIAISVPLYYSKKSRKVAIKYTLISGLTEPLGALLSFLFLRKYINDILLSFILIFVSGLMISLSINDMLSEIKKYNKTKYIIIGILLSIMVYIPLSLL